MVRLLSGEKAPGPAVLPRNGMTARDFGVFQRILYQQSGIVLTEAKRALVESRVTQRLRALRMDSYHSYLRFLAQDTSGEELVHLIDAISTNVTKFFREEDHFVLLDELVARWVADGARRLRFWSAGCATGEEPYTLAMVLHDHAVDHGLDLRILATDISTRALAFAGRGAYEPQRLSSVPAELRRRHFAERNEEGEYLAAEPLKRLIMFRRLNFTKMPYPINGVFDAIFCRNAMIYFDQDLRSRMVAEFARLLRPEGYLFVGHSETLIGRESLYRTIKPSVYQRLNDGGDA